MNQFSEPSFKLKSNSASWADRLATQVLVWLALYSRSLGIYLQVTKYGKALTQYLDLCYKVQHISFLQGKTPVKYQVNKDFKF